MDQLEGIVRNEQFSWYKYGTDVVDRDDAVRLFAALSAVFISDRVKLFISCFERGSETGKPHVHAVLQAPKIAFNLSKLKRLVRSVTGAYDGTGYHLTRYASSIHVFNDVLYNAKQGDVLDNLTGCTVDSLQESRKSDSRRKRNEKARKDLRTRCYAAIEAWYAQQVSPLFFDRRKDYDFEKFIAVAVPIIDALYADAGLLLPSYYQMETLILTFYRQMFVKECADLRVAAMTRRLH